jgi:hypothetical protein
MVLPLNGCLAHRQRGHKPPDESAEVVVARPPLGGLGCHGQEHEADLDPIQAPAEVLLGQHLRADSTLAKAANQEAEASRKSEHRDQEEFGCRQGGGPLEGTDGVGLASKSGHWRKSRVSGMGAEAPVIKDSDTSDVVVLLGEPVELDGLGGADGIEGHPLVTREANDAQPIHEQGLGGVGPSEGTVAPLVSVDDEASVRLRLGGASEGSRGGGGHWIRRKGGRGLFPSYGYSTVAT